MADEGYLWYGVLRIRHGEVPQRDFRSYEPGRYLWCGLFSLVFGRSLGAVRLATHAFYALCLGVALVTLRRVGLSGLELFLTAVLLAAWAHPMHKLYEPGLLLLGFSTSTWLALLPSPLTAALAGGAIGLAMLFGFNYFLYLGAAVVLLFVTAGGLATLALPLELFGWVALGAVLGGLPFAAFLATPGFLRAFIRRRVISILARGSTNLPLAVPWPWRPALRQLGRESRIRQFVYGALFVLLPAAPIAVLVGAWVWGPLVSARLAGIIAAATLGAVGWHHAYSRADRSHLAQAMAPLLLMAALALTSSLGLFILAVGSVALNWTLYPQVRRRRKPQQFKPLQLGWLRIWLRGPQHRILDAALDLSRRHLAHGGSLLALPNLPWLYAILGRRAPIYDIYAIFPASEAEQDRMLTSISQADVRVAFIANAPTDGREELRFSNTHPLVWRYIVATMEQVEVLPGSVHVFREHARADASTEISHRDKLGL